MSALQTKADVIAELNAVVDPAPPIPESQQVKVFPLNQNFLVHGAVKIVTLDTSANGGGYLVADGVVGGEAEDPGVEPAGRTGVSVSTPPVIPARPPYIEYADRVAASPVVG